MKALNFAVLVIIVLSMVSLFLGITVPILIVHKEVTANLLGFHVRLVNQTNHVSVISGIAELWEKNVALSVLVAVASIILPVTKHVMFTAAWLTRPSITIPAGAALARWSLVEPLALALLIVLAKFGDQLDVRAGPGLVPYLLSITVLLILHPLTKRRVRWEMSRPESLSRERHINFPKTSLRLAVLAAALCLSACNEKPKFSAIVSDAAGLRAGDDVIFMGADAGKVIRLRPNDGKIIVDFELKFEFKDRVRSGAKARAVCGLTSGFSSQLRIIGGTNMADPPLTAGEVIPEAGPFDAIEEKIGRLTEEGTRTLTTTVEMLKKQAAKEALKQVDQLRSSLETLAKPTGPLPTSTPTVEANRRQR
jgi:hypothetical protein